MESNNLYEFIHRIVGDALGPDGPQTGIVSREAQFRYEAALIEIRLLLEQHTHGNIKI